MRRRAAGRTFAGNSETTFACNNFYHLRNDLVRLDDVQFRAGAAYAQALALGDVAKARATHEGALERNRREDRHRRDRRERTAPLDALEFRLGDFVLPLEGKSRARSVVSGNGTGCGVARIVIDHHQSIDGKGIAAGRNLVGPPVDCSADVADGRLVDAFARHRFEAD